MQYELNAFVSEFTEPKFFFKKTIKKNFTVQWPRPLYHIYIYHMSTYLGKCEHILYMHTYTYIPT